MVAYKVISYVISFPGLTMLLSLCPFANFVDELAYYAYHSAQYNYYFSVIVDFSWNLTNSKWVPNFIR